MAFHKVEFETDFQRKHFEFFHAMNHPHMGVSVNVDVGAWLDMTRERSLKVTASLVYLLGRAANQVPQLRRRIRGDDVIEHDVVHPTFTVATDRPGEFGFCHVDYDEDIESFVRKATDAMAATRANPTLEDEPGRDDYLFMSAMPWVSFTSVWHAMQYHPHDSNPRIIWGRIFEAEGRTMMPVSVQAHHALVDGYHTAQFYERLDELVESAS